MDGLQIVRMDGLQIVPGFRLETCVLYVLSNEDKLLVVILEEVLFGD